MGRCVQNREWREGSGVSRLFEGCPLGCGRAHRAFRCENELTALPESFGQLAALQKLDLSRASAGAESHCNSLPWTVEQGER